MNNEVDMSGSLGSWLTLTVKAVKPRISNYTKPAFSEEFISNWVEGSIKLEELSL